MGREHRTESATDRVTGSVQSPAQFYLVGAPGVGKAKIADALADRFDERLAIFDEHLDTHWALGIVADYRIELHLALARFLRKSDLPTLHTHSLIDNLAYASYAVARYQFGTVLLRTMERAILTTTVLGTILRDSFKYDHVFFIHGDFDPDEDYQSELQAVQQMILDDFQINYSIIDAGPEAADQIGDILEGYLHD